jgi:pyruvate-ferredoxin/flavodoxin oxidoreductase
MAEVVDEWSATGKKNLWNQKVEVVEMQSEAGAAGAVHGSLKAGTLTTTYTASQGLLLMIPNMYKIAGELLPTVFHVAARAVSSNALNIFGDHSDVMAARQTGFAMLAESSVQEVMDLSAVAHLATLKSSIPFMNFFDGFRTSHELQKIEQFDYEDLKTLIDEEAIEKFRLRRMNPNHPTVSGTNQNSDVFFQQRESINKFYEPIPEIVRYYMQEVNKLRGTNYDVVNYYGDPEATEVIISMGSVAQTIEQTIDYLNANGRKVGFLNIHLYRPFPEQYVLDAIPSTVKTIAVLDRTKEPGAGGEPLLLDVQSLYYGRENAPVIIGGRYGLGSKDVRPESIIAVYDECLKSKEDMKQRFTLGIIDDVTYTNLEEGEPLDLTSSDTVQAKFWGLGSDGTVGANKSSIKIIGENTDKYCQAYFDYDSKKSGGLTVSHLRFGDTPIKSAYLIAESDYIACSTSAYLQKYNVLKGLKKKGRFVLNCVWTEEELEDKIPASYKKYIAENEIDFYIINANKLAREVGLGNRTNTILQAAFFQLSDILPIDQATELMKESAKKAYARKSMEIVEKNWAAIDGALERLQKVEVPKHWVDAVPEEVPINSAMKGDAFLEEVMNPINRQEGNSITTNTFFKLNLVDGSIPTGTTKYEKRGVASLVPEWIPENCISCNECSFVCPHAAIRPFLADEEEMENAPEGYITKDMRGADGQRYRIQVSVEDCTGCGLCIEACPAKNKALKVASYESQTETQAVNWAFAMTLKKKVNPIKRLSVASTQFETPLLEFSGACSGCGETPYVKLITQLFGSRMMMSNATGCSSIWGAAMPVAPYTTNEKGQGPTWSNSLLEDNAEFGYGMALANRQRREFVKEKAEELLEETTLPSSVREAIVAWLDAFDDKEQSRALSDQLEEVLFENIDAGGGIKEFYALKDHFVKISQWIIGGDGWAYDIGYGGLDHVLASGEDVNLFVMDNEVYSNTGGQKSKATPAAATAKFAAGGKYQSKKDLGMMAMTYGNVYVAQIASGANSAQTLKAIKEAEAFPGPSLIIAYTPCINHGLKGGMMQTLSSAKEAVESGYWALYRYNPELEEKGKSPMAIDFKKPDFNLMKGFMRKQVRFSALEIQFPEFAGDLFKKTVKDAQRRLKTYAQMSGDIEKLAGKGVFDQVED